MAQCENTVHATCVEVNGKGVLLCGKSGSGKSDLALRLIDRGCSLISDDQVVLARKGQNLVARAPEALKGLLEIRGVGISQFAFKSNIAIALIVDLVQGCLPERMPNFSSQRRSLNDVELPWIVLDPFETSACLKIATALDLLDPVASKKG